MASVQLSTKTLCATLLLVVILGSVLCPPCKARQLMQTREERIDALCDNIDNKLNNILDLKLKIFGQFAVNLYALRINAEANDGNLKDEFIRKFAKRCGSEPRGK